MCKEGKGVSTLLNTCQSCISVGWLLIIILSMCIGNQSIGTLIIPYMRNI